MLYLQEIVGNMLTGIDESLDEIDDDSVEEGVAATTE